ncbi:hypothetical protein RZ532_19035 [Nitratireductor aquimarinus]|uniref:hypothetical protein n=1 Tax=Nitratireductor aquimarinus TaxID=889300 RepID=UPI002936CC1B|nr:hypothetical protein [Nitratireductor aquimarinus]MDV2968093.1 hypothetical protein [Nitratireductor aquimarinus]
MIRTVLGALALAILMLIGVSAFTCYRESHRVTVMAFNAENLIDTEDDPANAGNDTYLPITVKQSNPDHEPLAVPTMTPISISGSASQSTGAHRNWRTM